MAKSNFHAGENNMGEAGCPELLQDSGCCQFPRAPILHPNERGYGLLKYSWNQISAAPGLKKIQEDES